MTEYELTQEEQEELNTFIIKLCVSRNINQKSTEEPSFSLEHSYFTIITAIEELLTEIEKESLEVEE